MTSQSENVHHGFWIDHEASFFTKYRYLTTEHWANIWTNFMAILTALVLSKLVRIAFKVLSVLSIGGSNTSLPAAQAPSLPLNNINTGGVHPPVQASSGNVILDPEAQDVIDYTHSSLGGVLRSIRAKLNIIRMRPVTLAVPNQPVLHRLGERLSMMWRNIKRERKTLGFLALILAICLASFIAESLLSVFNSVLTVGDDMAQSEATECGPILHPPSQSRDINQQTERDAAEYARTCSSQPQGAEGCTFFAHQAIPITLHHNQSCPFEQAICSAQGSGALRIDTGLFPLSLLGINSPDMYQINVSVTCVPLSTTATFVKKTLIDGIPCYLYYYGSYSNSDTDAGYTWKSLIDNFSSQYVGYNAYAFSSVSSGMQGAWQPHPMLTHRPHEPVTLLLISQHNVNHIAPRVLDPIFLTNTEKPFADDPNVTYYTDSTEMARPLACVETIGVCTPDGQTCRPLQYGPPLDLSESSPWPASAEPKGLESRAALFLAYTTLIRVDIFRSIMGRLGSGLVANEKLSQALSSPLAPEHWKDEAVRLVETLLAGWLVVARDVSRAKWASRVVGNDSGFYNFFDGITDPALRRAICKVYKFHSRGWKNVNVFGSSLMAVVLLLIFLVRLESEDEINVFRRSGTAVVQAVVRLYRLGVRIKPYGRSFWNWVTGIFRSILA